MLIAMVTIPPELMRDMATVPDPELKDTRIPLAAAQPGAVEGLWVRPPGAPGRKDTRAHLAAAPLGEVKCPSPRAPRGNLAPGRGILCRPGLGTRIFRRTLEGASHESP